MTTDDRYAELLEDANAGSVADLSDQQQAQLHDVRSALGADTTWASPPADLEDAVVAAVLAAQADAGVTSTAPPLTADTANDAAPVVSLDQARANRRSRTWIAAAGAIAAAFALLGFFAGSISSDSDTGRDPGLELAMIGTPLDADATGTIQITETGSGVAFTLNVTNLDPAPEGFYYQAWIKGPDGAITIGTFHARENGNNIELWSGVAMDNYPLVTVTLQEEGGGPMSSGQVVLKTTGN